MQGVKSVNHVQTHRNSAQLLDSAYRKMEGLSEEALVRIIAVIDEMISAPVTHTDADTQADRKKAAYQAMLDMKACSKYPSHIDEKKIKEEAIIKKYGRFN